MTMHWIDWTVVLVPMAIVTVIGIKTQRHVKGVSDFLAAGRCGNRYLLSVAEGMAGIGLISIVALFEKYYNSGWAIGWWEGLLVGVWLLLALTGFVIYRYR
jgi:SSS family solute:Na+ symporter